MSNRALFVLTCSALASGSWATGFFFDDQADGVFTNQYIGIGVTSDGASEIWGGIGNGDPGNWGLFGTNGSKFLGNNGGNSYITTIFFAGGVSGVSFDISRSNGSDPSDSFQARIYDSGNTLLNSTGGGFNPINEWTHVAFGNNDIARLEVQSFGQGFHPYGTDDYNFNAVPEPASLAALGLGLLTIGRRRFRK